MFDADSLWHHSFLCRFFFSRSFLSSVRLNSLSIRLNVCIRAQVNLRHLSILSGVLFVFFCQFLLFLHFDLYFYRLLCFFSYHFFLSSMNFCACTHNFFSLSIYLTGNSVFIAAFIFRLRKNKNFRYKTPKKWILLPLN